MSKFLRLQTGETVTVLGRRVSIPFLTAPFSQDLMLVLALWPLWWVLGVEQLLPPVFLAWETVRSLVRNRGRFSLNAPVVWAGLLALWWFAPVAWLDPEYVGIFLKEAAAAWCQVLILFLFLNEVRTEQGRRQVMRGLYILAACVAVGGVVYALGLWRGRIVSTLGLFVPASLESSTFFSSMIYRSLGRYSNEGGLLPWRLTSLNLYATSLSLVCLLLIPLVSWRAALARARGRVVPVLIVLGLVVCLVGTGSRIAYVAFAAGCAAFGIHVLNLYLRPKQMLIYGVAALLVLGIAAVAVVGIDRMAESVRYFFVQWRPGSWALRGRVYEATLRMLPEHPIAGWGVQMQLPGQRSSFSAGSHSSLLGMLFRHGIVGLVLYVALWASIWREVVRGLRQRGAPKSARWFWVAAAIAMMCFNIRELADTWWWDQTLTMAIWCMWGLIVVGPATGPESAAGAVDNAAPERAT